MITTTSSNILRDVCLIALVGVSALLFFIFLAPPDTQAGCGFDDQYDEQCDAYGCNNCGGDGGGGGGSDIAVDLTATPSSISSGSSSTLVWSATGYGTITCTLSHYRYGVDNYSTVIGNNLSFNDSRVVSPTQTMGYIIDCYSTNGSYATDNEVVTVTAPSETPWVDMGCGLINDSYNGSCNPTAEWFDIECQEGEMLQGRTVTGGPACEPPNNWSREQRRCVADVSCPVTPPAQPNLTAGAVTPTTATAGTSIPLRASISNIGVGATGAGFPNLWQIDDNADHTSAYENAVDSTGAVAPGNSVTSGIDRSLSAGTWYVRVCADNNASWVGSISESNEGDNCGPWTTLTVSNPVPPSPTASLSCSPGSCSAPTGTPVTLTYACSNSTSATLSTFGSLSPVGGGSRSTNTAGPYTLTCTGPGGSANDSETVSFSTPTVSITATPDRVRSGQTTLITWTGDQVTSCVGTNFSTGGAISGTVTSAPITSQTTYTVTCDGGTATDTVIVNIVPNFEEF